MADQDTPGGRKPPPPAPPGTPMTKTRQRLGTGGGSGGGGAPRPTPPPRAAAPPPEAAEPAAVEAAPAQPTPPAAPPPARPAPPAQPAAAAGGNGEAPTRPTPPAAGAPRPAPARPAANGGDGAPARPAAAPGAPARPAPAAAGARPAPAAGGARPAPAAAGATAERLAAAVSREPASAGGGAQSQSLVYVWPHLVTIEFISAVVMLLSMIILSTIVNSPLEAHANPDRTPNPSKAPWYFLNLQELLIHMHPALAGVIVPSAALGLIAAIPYFDRDQSDVGKWFGTKNSFPIFVFVTIYTSIVEIALILFDAFKGVKPTLNDVANLTGINYFREQTPFGVAVFSMPDVIVPTFLMLAPIAPMMWFIHKKWKPNTREVMVALFTGFFISYVILTIFGTFFRGQGMTLLWPWDPGQVRIE